MSKHELEGQSSKNLLSESSLLCVSPPRSLLENVGEIVGIEELRMIHDRNTISKSFISVIVVTGKEGEKTLAVKRYSQEGFPDTEFAAYGLLQDHREIFDKFPKPYFAGHDINGNPLLIMEYVFGNKLSEILPKARDKAEELDYFNLLKLAIEELKEIGLSDRLSALCSNSWLKPDTLGLQDFIIKGYMNFIKSMPGLVPDQNIRQLIDWVSNKTNGIDELSYSLRHGDVAAGNIIFSTHVPKEGKIAFLDWEYSFYGPLEKDIADLIATFLFNSRFLSTEDMLPAIDNRDKNIKAILNLLLLRVFVEASVDFRNKDFGRVKINMQHFKNIQQLL